MFNLGSLSLSLVRRVRSRPLVRVRELSNTVVIQDDLRYWITMADRLGKMSSSSAENNNKKIYSCLVVPRVDAISDEDKNNNNDSDLLSDWNDVHGTAMEFGGPEFADHVSGHMFMRGSPVEDKSSKGVRLADTVHRFTDGQIVRCVQGSVAWGEHLAGSAVLQGMVRGMDRDCCRRYRSGDCGLTSQEFRFTVGFALCRLMVHLTTKPEFPMLLWRNLRSQEDETSRAIEETVLFLLLTVLCRGNKVTDSTTVLPLAEMQMQDKVLDSFAVLSHTELAVCYGGLRCFSEEGCRELGEKMAAEFGFRL